MAGDDEEVGNIPCVGIEPHEGVIGGFVGLNSLYDWFIGGAGDLLAMAAPGGLELNPTVAGGTIEVFDSFAGAVCFDSVGLAVQTIEVLYGPSFCYNPASLGF